MKVTLKPGIEVETITLAGPEFAHTNEVYTTLLEVQKVSLFIAFFWDSHGNMIPFEGFNNEETFMQLTADVKIVKYTYTSMGSNWEDWYIVIDGDKKSCSVTDYDFNPRSNLLRIKATVGWG